MLESFSVKNLRCLNDIKFTGLKKINLITGENNVGKTALLEAIFLHSAGVNPQTIFTIDGLRGFDTLKLYASQRNRPPWSPLFANFQEENKIVLTGTSTRKRKRVVSLRMISELDEVERILKRFTSESSDSSPDPLRSTPLSNPQIIEMTEKEPNKKSRKYYMLHDRGRIQVAPIPAKPSVQAYYMSPRNPNPSIEQADRFAELQLDKRDSLLVDALKLVEPRLQRLSMVVHAGQPVIHGDIGLSRLVPIPFMGAGMMRLTGIVLGIINYQRGIILIDEIEVGLHYSIIGKVWQTIAKIAKQFNTQIFATTHSRECILSAHNTFKKMKNYDFNYSRLERQKGKMRSISYDFETLQTAIDSGLEVR